MPNKASVQTSLGELYVRHTRVSDLELFIESGDEKVRGEVVVSTLTSRIKDKDDTTPLSSEDVAALTEADIASLTRAIAQKNDWGNLPEGHPLTGLGQLAKQDMVNQQKRLQEALESMRGSIGRDYGFLSSSVLAKLNEQVGGIAAIQSGLPFGALEALKHSGADLDAATSPVRAAMAAMKIGGSNTPKTESPKRINVQPMPGSIKFSETPVGLATIENAKNSRDVLEKISALVQLTAGLSQTLATEVLPAWFKQAESDALTAKKSLEHAERGIRLAIVSIVISAFISIGATVWQVSVTRDIDKEGTVQQKKNEEILREQLVTQRTLIERQTSDAEKLRELLRQQSKDKAQHFEMTRSAEKASSKK